MAPVCTLAGRIGRGGWPGRGDGWRAPVAGRPGKSGAGGEAGRGWTGAGTGGRTGATGAGVAWMMRGRPPGKKPWMTREGEPAWRGWIGLSEGVMIAMKSKELRSDPFGSAAAIARLRGIDPRQNPADGGLQFGKTMLVDADLAEAHALVPAGQLARSVVLAGQCDPTLAKLKGGPRRGAE